MSLITIKEKEVAKSSVLNNNFEYLQNEIMTLTSTITSISESITSQLATYETQSYPIGDVRITFKDTLGDNEVWLHGDTVSRTTYANLFAIYGTTYGEGDGSTTFKLPDFRNRTVWGGTELGYIEASLPNIKGSIGNANYGTASGAFHNKSGNGLVSQAGSDGNTEFDASRCSSVYKDECETVIPPSVVVRFKTRYK